MSDRRGCFCAKSWSQLVLNPIEATSPTAPVLQAHLRQQPFSFSCAEDIFIQDFLLDASRVHVHERSLRRCCDACFDAAFAGT